MTQSLEQISRTGPSKLRWKQSVIFNIFKNIAFDNPIAIERIYNRKLSAVIME